MCSDCSTKEIIELLTEIRECICPINDKMTQLLDLTEQMLVELAGKATEATQLQVLQNLQEVNDKVATEATQLSVLSQVSAILQAVAPLDGRLANIEVLIGDTNIKLDDIILLLEALVTNNEDMLTLLDTLNKEVTQEEVRDLLEEIRDIQAQNVAFTESVWKDAGNNDIPIIRRVEYDQTSNQYVTTFYLPDGTVYTPVDPQPILDDKELIQTCFIALNSGVDYNTGDVIQSVNVYDAGLLVSTFFINAITGAVVVPLTADLQPCAENAIPDYNHLTVCYKDSVTGETYLKTTPVNQKDNNDIKTSYYIDNTGAIATPNEANLVLCSESGKYDYEHDICLQASVNGTGYTEGDLITLTKVYDKTLADSVPTVTYFNNATSLYITPVMSDLKPCALSTNKEATRCIMDLDTGDIIYEIFEHGDTPVVTYYNLMSASFIDIGTIVNQGGCCESSDSYDYEITDCYKAIADSQNGDYVTGDTVKKVVIFKVGDTDNIEEIKYLHDVSNQYIAFNSSDFEPCSSKVETNTPTLLKVSIINTDVTNKLLTSPDITGSNAHLTDYDYVIVQTEQSPFDILRFNIGSVPQGDMGIMLYNGGSVKLSKAEADNFNFRLNHRYGRIYTSYYKYI